MIRTNKTFNESLDYQYYDYYEDNQNEVDDDELVEIVACEPHNCPNANVLWSNGKCVEEIECAEDGEIIFDEETQMTDCQFVLRSVIVVPEVCKTGDRKTIDGECKELIELGKQRPGRGLAIKTKSLAKYLRLRRGKGSM